MDKISWIKDLVKAEQQMEESGLVDMTYGYDADRMLAHETLQFLLLLKTEFVDSSSTFNELKPSPLGRIKVYGIAKTHADFMLFRNGYKMIFTLKAAGEVGIRFNFIGSSYVPGTGAETSQGTHLIEEQIISAKWGPFGQIIWCYQGQPVNMEFMIRHYMTLFLRESAK